MTINIYFLEEVHHPSKLKLFFLIVSQVQLHVKHWNTSKCFSSSLGLVCLSTNVLFQHPWQSAALSIHSIGKSYLLNIKVMYACFRKDTLVKLNMPLCGRYSGGERMLSPSGQFTALLSKFHMIQVWERIVGKAGTVSQSWHFYLDCQIKQNPLDQSSMWAFFFWQEALRLFLTFFWLLRGGETKKKSKEKSKSVISKANKSMQKGLEFLLKAFSWRAESGGIKPIKFIHHCPSPAGICSLCCFRVRMRVEGKTIQGRH